MYVCKSDASLEELSLAMRPNTKAVFAETISNPSIVILDIEKFAALAHMHGVPLIVDNTFATPMNCRPFAWGADIVTHSTTKYMDGHAMSVGGAIIDSGNFDWMAHKDKFPGLTQPDASYHGITYAEQFGKAAYITKATAQLMRDLGAIPSPMNAFLLNVGLETLHLRMARHCENAQKVAEFLDAHEKVAWVNYAGLSGNRYHALAQKYMPNGTCGVLAFAIKGERERAIRFMDALKLTAIVTHVADARTCILHPASHTHRQMTTEQLIEAGISPELMRLSVGIEHVDDILWDFGAGACGNLISFWRGFMKKILFAASECVPFIKTGGLADVCGALPKEFDKTEWDVRVVLPNYSCIREEYRSQFTYVTHFYMSAGNDIADKYVGVLKYVLEGITYYLIDNREYFDCETPYGDIRYDIEKFCFFDKAVLSILKQIDFRPDLIHCHDWETGLIPVYLKNEFQADSFYWGIKSVMTIHNLKFQGVWDVKTMRGLTGFAENLFTPDKLEFRRDANMLKGGLVYADYITTVSDSYAQEIQTEYYGEGLNGLLAARHFDMQGIVNGIDYEVYNPQTDDKLYVNDDAQSFRKKKYLNKTKLQEEIGLTVDKKKYMIGLISRLTDQKGLDLVRDVMDHIVDDYTQLVVIGTGDAQYENMFRHYAWKYADRVSANICYSDELAHKLYGAADAFLMPSRFEPCGLTQLISFRYGTVPIVRETGGLKDTVHPFNEYENTGDGFSYANYNSGEMLGIINYSKHIYFDRRKQWNQMIDRGMANDYSWRSSKGRYEGLYRYLLGEC